MRTFVDLFAGCGGLALGLESAGFNRIFANEISPMAAETYAFNLAPGVRNSPAPTPQNLGVGSFTWLSLPVLDANLSQASFRDWRSHDSPKRRSTPECQEALRTNGRRDVLVGTAWRLHKELLLAKADGSLRSDLKNLDLLAGGPPCQSFSSAGLREMENPRNKLYQAFVGIADVLQPKAILFENVVGITNSFRSANGNRWYAWYDVCVAMRSIGYYPIPALVNAADFGVPQNRNRFLVAALRADLADRLLSTPERTAQWPRLSALLCRAKANFTADGIPKDASDLILRHRDRGDWPEALLPQPLFPARSIEDAIDGIKFSKDGDPISLDEYGQFLSTELPAPDGVKVQKTIENHALRRHSPITEGRIRVMQALASANIRPKNFSDVLLDRRNLSQLLKKRLLFPLEGKAGKLRRPRTIDEVQQLLNSLTSSKHIQRCLHRGRPAPAQLSIPDDYIHYDPAVPRVLTIREMARIQSFPDWFVFRSKPTTGGTSRAYEVPQYTQVANAVPPLLAKQIGDSITKVLETIQSSIEPGGRSNRQDRSPPRLQPT
jgi:DNA (cytosine-5)-methyltransferase 1